jgi:hypothetical protein
MKPVNLPLVRLRATLLIDRDAIDFAEAADFQVKLQDFYDAVHRQFPNATLEIRERRAAGKARKRVGRGAVATGSVHAYED